MKKLTKLFFSFLIPALLLSDTCLAESPVNLPQEGKPTYAGELFGERISRDEFQFTMQTVGLFSITGKEPANEAEKRSEAWKHLIFLREANKRKVDVPAADLRAELTRLLDEKQVPYGSPFYVAWVKANFGETVSVFERRLENTLRIKKMINTIMNPPPPTIKDSDAKQKFLNQYNSMGTEFVNFPTLEEAKAFYKKTSSKKWDQEKAKNPKFSTPTGHISLEALIDLWQVPTEDAYRIHALALGKIAAPAKMYKGYGVFRVKEKKTADISLYTEAKKNEYIKILKQVYYYNNTQKIFQDIVNEAKLRDYDFDKIIVVETNQGTFELQLYTLVAPKACENLIGLAEKKYYDNTLFHRVIKGFMIQGGDPTATGQGGASVWGEPFADETDKNVQFEKAGILAMANSGPNTNGSQFFITLAPTPNLNNKHTIFGEVVSGYEVVRKIGQTVVGDKDKPVEDQKIIRLYLKKWL